MSLTPTVINPPIYTHTVTPYAEEVKCSTAGYWVAIIFLLALVALFVILFIVALRDEPSPCEALDIPNAQIKATATAITATWDDLADPDDTVTLYASMNQLKLNPLGVPVNKDVIKVTASGEEKSVQMTVGASYPGGTILVNTTYYVALVVTKDDLCQYHTVHDIVFTQGNAIVKSFTDIGITSLTQKGGIGINGSFVDSNTGGGSIGLWNFTNEGFLTISPDSQSSSEGYLCNSGGQLAVSQPDSPGDSCKWVYNPEGLNRWCNAAKVNGTTYACMIRNGTSSVINVSTGSTDSEPYKWANTPFFLSLESPDG